MSVNRKALLMQLQSIEAAVQAAFALLVDEDEDGEPEAATAPAPPTAGLPELPQQRPRQDPIAHVCKHKHREDIGGFGGERWYCLDCGATGEGRVT